ncbi:fluoride efflux transporter CrcB [Pseudorhodoferax sp.]|uniref:fluoride efflux transporter CrcB n=1 Tax=Pseudorhodoferax sp. TaxID=1993553 RepID=UPI0039E4AD0E
MSGLAILAVFSGAGLGALLRWWLSILLNPIFPTIPMGTVSANLIGGLLVGVSSAYFNHHSGLPPEFRLLVITGFLGGLTTFSTFSVEVVTLIGRHEYAWALGAASLHLGGSLLLTGAGIFLAHWLLIRS